MVSPDGVCTSTEVQISTVCHSGGLVTSMDAESKMLMLRPSIVMAA